MNKDMNESFVERENNDQGGEESEAEQHFSEIARNLRNSS